MPKAKKSAPAKRKKPAPKKAFKAPAKKKTKAKRASKKRPQGKIPAKLLKYLEKANVDYKILKHKTVYTAFDAAATLKRKLDEIAKPLLLKAGRDYYLAILPANKNVNFDKLANLLSRQSGRKVKTVKIPSEQTMAKALKIKAGSLSAFGSLYKIPVIMEKQLAKLKKAVFSAGSLNHSLELKVKDFIDLEKAILGSFSVKKPLKTKKKTTKKPKKS